MELRTQHAVLAGILGASIAAVLITDIRSRGLFPAGRRSGGFRIPVRTLKYIALVAIVLAVPAAAAQALGSPQCFVNGGGNVDGDSFGGTAKSNREGTIYGAWYHRSADGRVFDGDVDALICRRNGGEAEQPKVEFSIGDVSGSMTVDGAAGYVFTVQGQDHGEGDGASDTYRIVVSDENGQIVYATGGLLDSGNFQIHATNQGHP